MPLGLRVWAVLFTVTCGVSFAQELNDTLLSAVQDRLAEGATHSWELGTRCQALLELNVPAFSVFSGNSLPPPNSIPSSITSVIAPVFSITASVVSNLNTTDSSAPQPLINGDGSAADPASLGVAVLLANWTGQKGGDYATAAKNQLNYLLEEAPRTSDGAISHRTDQVQLWSDFVYMVPPFLAYYGALSGNSSLLTESYNQIKLYRSYLRDPDTSLWHHITLGSQTDPGFWSTGNAWAAAGILRVLATIQQSSFSSSFQSEQNDLADWAQEIHSGMYNVMDDTNFFTNYANVPISQSGSFYDASSTALLAASVYRISTLVNDHSHVPHAEGSRKALSTQAHFTIDGWLEPVVNPLDGGVQGSQSPEGQAFVLEMQAGWKDWVAAGSLGSGSVKLNWNSFWVWIGFISGTLLLII